MGRIRHGFHAASNHDVGVTSHDHAPRQVDSVHAAQTDLVDGGRRDRQGDSGIVGGLAGCDLSGAGLQHLTHDDIVDIGPCYA